jgi:hypothetical protein
MRERRFPSPWSVEEQSAYFAVRDHNGQRLPMSISRMNRGGDQRPSCSPANRRGASPPISPSCQQLVRKVD